MVDPWGAPQGKHIIGKRTAQGSPVRLRIVALMHYMTERATSGSPVPSSFADGAPFHNKRGEIHGGEGLALRVYGRIWISPVIFSWTCKVQLPRITPSPAWHGTPQAVGGVSMSNGHKSNRNPNSKRTKSILDTPQTFNIADRIDRLVPTILRRISAFQCVGAQIHLNGWRVPTAV